MVDPMSSAHKYTYEFDLSDDNHAGAHVVRLVGRGKRVLDVGSGPGSITRYLREPGGCRIVAIENDPDAAARVGAVCEHVLQCDLNSPTFIDAVRGAGVFDVVVMADVLEHLYDPWGVLQGMKAMLKADGYFVVSLPHAGHNAVLAALLNADFEYRDSGLLDRTHIRFFGMRNLQSLFERAGLQIVEAHFVTRYPGVTELAHHWMALSERLRTALLENRFGSVYQVVVKAQPQRAGLSGFDLRAIPAPHLLGSWVERTLGPIGRRFLARMNPATRRRLKSLLLKTGVLRR